MPVTSPPHGISRTLPGSRRTRRVQAPRLSDRAGEGALRSDLRTAVDALTDELQVLADEHNRLVDQLDNVEGRLATRVNEMVLSGTLAERPAAGVADRLYLVVTNHTPGPLYFDDGSQWILIGSPTLEVHRAVLADGAISHTFTVAQPGAVYAAAFGRTWWTMVKIAVQTATVLTVEFSNPAAAGDVLTVVIP